MNTEPANTPAVAQRKGWYFARHWRGELSLFKSFWLDAIVLSVAIFLLSGFLSGRIVEHFRQQLALAVTLIIITFVVGICIFVWSLVGLWRSAGVYAGRRIWAVPARVVTVGWLGLITLSWITLSHTLLTTYYNCTTGRDFGELAPFFQFGPCELAWYPQHGLVVRRLARDSFRGTAIDLFK